MYSVSFDALIKILEGLLTLELNNNDHNHRWSCKPCDNSLISSLSLRLKSFEEEIQPFRYCVDIYRG